MAEATLRAPAFYEWYSRLVGTAWRYQVQNPFFLDDYVEDFERGESPAGALILALESLGMFEAMEKVIKGEGLAS